MVLRLVGLACLLVAASAASSIMSTGGCAKALAHCGGIHKGDVVYYEVKNSDTLTVVDVKDLQIMDCPSWIFEREEKEELCPVFAYPYLASLFAYAIMIALGVLMVVSWMATVCADDSSCVFRVGLATYWFADLGAAIFASFVVQSYNFQIGYHWCNILLAILCTNVYTTLAYEGPMMFVQHACCVPRRGLLFVMCAASLGILWSGMAFSMALNPRMSMLYGAHPLAVASVSFLLDMVKKMVVRQVRRCCGWKPSKQLDLELGLCLRSISSAVPEDNAPSWPRQSRSTYAGSAPATKTSELGPDEQTQPNKI